LEPANFVPPRSRLSRLAKIPANEVRRIWCEPSEKSENGSQFFKSTGRKKHRKSPTMTLVHSFSLIEFEVDFFVSTHFSATIPSIIYAAMFGRQGRKKKEMKYIMVT
jgi:hypothetical protein